MQIFPSGLATTGRAAELEGVLERLRAQSRNDAETAQHELNEARSARERERRDAEDRIAALREELRGAADRESQAVERGEHEAAKAKAELRVRAAEPQRFGRIASARAWARCLGACAGWNGVGWAHGQGWACRNA